jgi:antitoxin YokJ
MSTVKSIKSIISGISASSNCKVIDATGLPTLLGRGRLPPELIDFYNLCGGIELCFGSEYSLKIVTPSQFRPANIEIFGERIEDDISSSWYVVAEGRSGEYVSVDLSADRCGRCYDSYVDRHGVAGSCPVIALSFGEFLERCWARLGSRFYWLEDQFQSYGDAYD